MRVVSLLRSSVGRVLKVAAGVWLLEQGMALATLGGLVMTMAGVFLTVTGLAGLSFIKGTPKAWTAGHVAASHARRDHTSREKGA
jgi:hypothetical protein